MFVFFNFDDLILFEITFYLMLFLTVVVMLYFTFGKQYKSLLYIAGGNLLYASLSLTVIHTIAGGVSQTYTLVAFFDLTAMVFWMLGFLTMFRQKLPHYEAISIIILNVVLVFVLSRFTNDFSLFRFITTFLITISIFYTAYRLILDEKSTLLPSFRYSIYMLIIFASFKLFLSFYRLRVFFSGHTILAPETAINIMSFVSLLFAIWLNIVYVFLNNDILLNKMKLLSHHDYLTKLPNRREIIQKLEEYHEMNLRHIVDYTLMMIDLDDFKKVNDEYGHQTGDQVLIEFSNLINEKIRKVDLFGRYGGEEFVLVVLNSDKKVIRQLVERMSLLVKNTQFTENEITISFSAGVIIVDNTLPFKNITEVINKADERLYVAKGRGKDRIIMED